MIISGIKMNILLHYDETYRLMTRFVHIPNESNDLGSRIQYKKKSQIVHISLGMLCLSFVAKNIHKTSKKKLSQFK